MINDPIHNLMFVDKCKESLLKPFIDSANFQRLRHIKQLGLGDLVFPSACHARFSHSLGTAHIATKMAAKLGLSAKAEQLTLIAALLHDIGHGPFSHTFEQVLNKHFHITHEDWNAYFMQEFCEESFLELYHDSNPNMPLSVTHIQKVAAIVAHNSKDTVANSIISSQIDADRLDYLLRDAHFCGVQYGKYDLDWLLSHLELQHNQMVFNYKAIAALEQYLLARGSMTKQVYFHRSIVGMGAMLVFLLQSICKVVEDIYQLIPSTKASPLLQFLKLATKQDKQTFMQASYPLYKQLTDYDIWHLLRVLSTNEKTPAAIKQLASSIFHRSVPKSYSYQPKMHLLIVETINNASMDNKLEPWELFVCQDNKDYYVNDRQSIMISHNQQIASLEEHSNIVKSLASTSIAGNYLFVQQDSLAKPQVAKAIQQLSKQKYIFPIS